MTNFNGTGKFIGALMLGSLVGASIGLLFAPYKGSRTRKLLANGAREMADEITTKVKEKVSDLRHRSGKMEDLATDTVN
jgi:gas vesicle protein